MKLTPEELENIARMLMSSDHSNVRLGLALLEQHSENIEALIAPLLVLRNGLDNYTTENEQLKAEVGVLLKKHLPKKLLHKHEQHFYAFDLMEVQANKLWSEFMTQLQLFENNIELYEPYILSNADYAYSFYYSMAEYLKRRYKKPERAYSYIKKILDLSFEDVDIKVFFVDLMVNEIFYQGKHFEELDRVVDYTNILIAAYPYYAESYYNILGIVYDIYLMEKSKAKEYYYKTLDENPRHDGALNNLANILYKIDKNYDEALRLIQLALEIAPRDVHSLDTYACILFYGYHKLDEAEAVFRELLSIKRTHHPSLTALGEVLEAKGEYEEAFEWYEKALKIRPKSEYKLTKMADLLYLKMNKPAEALHYYEKLRRNYPENEYAKERVAELKKLL